ncbi:MAG: response regulator [Nitrospirae bacterium]|nr:response regulator [Nitrospirota bacterium]
MEEKLSVLVVDDDDSILGMLKDCFVSEGYSCKIASSAGAALGILQTNSFDFMITDVVMPGMDGFRLTTEARNAYPNMPVIVMTGYSEDDSFKKAIDAGAADFIKKPFSFRELIVRVQHIRREFTETRKRELEFHEISREIIDGLQNEVSQRMADLQEEIQKLKGKLPSDKAELKGNPDHE